MVRWEPGTPERLQAAALELFTTRGFEQTTAADIAAAVGVTERTFFRHFPDKREVLFDGQDRFVRAFLDPAHAAPAEAAPMAVVRSGVLSACGVFVDERREHSRLRQGVIDANPPLLERERHKLAGLAVSMTEELRARGVGEPAATLAAESGATVFRIAFAQWIRDGETRSMPDIAAQVFAELSVVARTTGTG